MTDGTKQIETEVAERIITEEIACATGPTGGWLDSPKAIAAAILLRLKMRSNDAPAQPPTDPSKRYWITEQGMKEAAEDLRDHAWLNLSDPSELDCVIDVIAAHSEAASPPRLGESEHHIPLTRASVEKLSSGGTIRFADITLVGPAAPPQGTPAPELCPNCQSVETAYTNSAPRDRDWICRHPWHSTVAAQKEKPENSNG